MKTSIHKWDSCIAGVLISALLLLNGCDNNSTGPDGNENTVTILQIVKSQNNLSTLQGLLEETGYKNILDGDGQYTLFAPSDDAFGQLPEDYLDNLTGQQKVDLIKYHIINSSHPIENRFKRETITTMKGDWLYVEKSEVHGDRINNTAKFGSKNITAKNGYVHIVDEVLSFEKIGTLYDNISKMDGFNTFAERMETAGLSDFLASPGDKTLIPSKDSWLESYESDYGRPFTDYEWKTILQYHLIDLNIADLPIGSHQALPTLLGDSLYFYKASHDCFSFNNDGGCGWYSPEGVFRSTNGYLVFNFSTILPDRFIEILPVMYKRNYLRTFNNILPPEVFERLYNRVGNEDEKFTIFVPSDNAAGFNNLPTDEDELTELLKYHILLEPFTLEQLQDGQNYVTWQGQSIQISKFENSIVINGSASVTQVNLIGKNGVIFVINRVLTPAAD